ncbi:MAG TPA: dipeptidase [Steroidobacteraceae bacterium]|nr:dipeptidase [Steroidobacteraceae bacterium]
MGQDFTTRARELHERVITIDSHSAFPLDSCGATDLQVDVPKMRMGGLDVAFFVVWIGQQKRTVSAYAEAKRRALREFQAIHDAVERCHNEVNMARTPEDVEQIIASGKLALAVGVENGFAIGRELSLLKTYRDLGAAYLGLTHEGHNDIADSANPIGALGDGATEHGGVSEFGERVIAEMNRLGIMVDVSHLSKAATLETIRLSRAPVIASHSSIYAIVPNPRNMDDETLLAMAAKGGVIQITPVHSFVKVDPPGAMEAFTSLLREFGLESDAEARKLSPGRRAEFDDRLAALDKHWALATVGQMVDHIDYAVALAGVEHVGVGSDFDGGGGVAGWSDAGETASVTTELLRRGYTEDEIQKIWGGNLLRVWREVRRLSDAAQQPSPRMPGVRPHSP